MIYLPFFPTVHCHFGYDIATVRYRAVIVAEPPGIHPATQKGRGHHDILE
jgi:hypothetical protein